jgi:hypothetical protein
MIKHLLYKERYSIEGARNRIRELRREGELSTFKKETSRGAEGGASREKLVEVRKKAQELLELSRTPLRDLFKC